MDIVSFLEGKTPDHRGRMLFMLWKQTDDHAENNHDYIQWMFPLEEPSQAVNGAPVLNDFDTSYDHNHLRITRAIKSLRLLTSDQAADEFRDKVIALAGDNLNLVDQEARDFWASA